MQFQIASFGIDTNVTFNQRRMGHLREGSSKLIRQTDAVY